MASHPSTLSCRRLRKWTIGEGKLFVHAAVSEQQTRLTTTTLAEASCASLLRACRKNLADALRSLWRLWLPAHNASGRLLRAPHPALLVPVLVFPHIPQLYLLPLQEIASSGIVLSMHLTWSRGQHCRPHSRVQRPFPADMQCIRHAAAANYLTLYCTTRHLQPAGNGPRAVMTLRPSAKLPVCSCKPAQGKGVLSQQVRRQLVGCAGICDDTSQGQV